MYSGLTNFCTDLWCTPVSLTWSRQPQYLWPESHYLCSQSHLGELQLVPLVPKPAFLPLFRLTPGIQGVRQGEFAPHAGVGGEVVLSEERCSPQTHREPGSEERETTEEGIFTRS